MSDEQEVVTDTPDPLDALVEKVDKLVELQEGKSSFGLDYVISRWKKLSSNHKSIVLFVILIELVTDQNGNFVGRMMSLLLNSTTFPVPPLGP